MEYNKEQLFKICKILAENDSVAEGYNYCAEYKRERFEEEFEKEDYGYITVAKEIIGALNK